jgi:hypothetical protein
VAVSTAAPKDTPPFTDKNNLFPAAANTDVPPPIFTERTGKLLMMVALNVCPPSKLFNTEPILVPAIILLPFTDTEITSAVVPL